MEPLEKDVALALRIAPWSNTSRMVLWLGRRNGRIATMVKGSQRPKSFFLGQYDLFYTCDLVFYRRERGGMHLLRECAPLDLREGLRGNWRASAIASYAADVVARALQDEAPAPGVFDLLAAAWDELAAHGLSAGILSWFELHLMAELGLEPSLARCVGCGQDVTRARGAGFSCARGGVLCRRCGASRDGAPEPAAPDTLALLRSWRQAPRPGAARRIVASARQQREAERLVGRFLRHHLDLRLPSRDAALEGAGLAPP